MKKLLLSFLLTVITGFSVFLNAQQTITLKIIETGKDGETSISFDDGEYENDAIDKLNDDDLDMGWEGEDLNIMTAFTRFQNVEIPQGALINSAKLVLYAHEDESAPAYIKVYAEDIDNSPLFTETELLTDRAKTSTSVAWDCTENWTMWQPYESPDLSGIIQEVINRPGWNSGNSLTLFLMGKDQGASLLDNARDFESFENIEDPDDGGDGLHHPERIPTLIIEFTDQPVVSVENLELVIMETGKDGETSISFDDGEYENDAIDKLNDDDLDMGWEGEDLNIMTAFTRFRNVTIPEGSVIKSAKLKIYAHEDESAPAYITIMAEAIDDSPLFNENELLTDREKTQTNVKWNCTENWTMWQPYESPDLSAIIQEVVNREGWESGNSLTLFMMGEDQGASLLDNARDFESFENIEDPDDGGDGLHHPERIPRLLIEYIPPVVEANELILTIIETGKDGETSISFDDGEYENDAIDKLNDDDLDMGWEGEDLNIMTAFTRFRNVTIPQGALIDSAVLVIYAHEDESAPAYITVMAEDADDSPLFTETELLSDREKTQTTVQWDCTDNWTMWQPYHSPNLASIIQEVVNRPGWQTGNSLTLFMMGQDQGASLLDNARDFESFENIEDPDDGGNGLHHPERIPALKIYYRAVNTGFENIQLADITLFPNPVINGILNISGKNEFIKQVQIFNVSGTLIKDFKINSNSARLDINELNNGLYIVRAFLNKDTITRKIIVK